MAPWASGRHHDLRCPSAPSRRPGEGRLLPARPYSFPLGAVLFPEHLDTFFCLSSWVASSAPLRLWRRVLHAEKKSCQPHCGPKVQPQDTCWAPSSCKGAGPRPLDFGVVSSADLLSLPVPSPLFPNAAFLVIPRPVQPGPHVSPLAHPAEAAQGSSPTELGHQPPGFQALPHATHSSECLTHSPSKRLTHPCVFLPTDGGFQDARFLPH